MSTYKYRYTMQEFLNFINSTRNVKTKYIDSFDEDYHFTGTSNFDEALDLIQNGSKDIREKLHKELAKLEGTPTKETSYIPDTEGLFFDVARVLEGEPEQWYKPTDKTKKYKLEVTVQSSYRGNVRVDSIIENSALLISYLKDIESKGIEVKLNLIYSSDGVTKTKDNEEIIILMKDYQEPFNYDKLSGAIHPSFFRRLVFRHREVKYGDNLDSGYGSTNYFTPTLHDRQSVIDYFEGKLDIKGL